MQGEGRRWVLITGNADATPHGQIFNRTSLQHKALSLNGHTSPVEKLRYMDRYAVSGGKDNVVKVWAL